MIGSVWNKWDLHIHTPYTHQANEFKEVTIEEYVRKIDAEGLKLIGVTNYFYFADKELEVIRDEVRRQGKKITVLGNLEFRIHQPNKDGEWINVHCIFSENMSTDRINDVMSHLVVENTTPEGRPIYLSEVSFTNCNLKVGEATVNFSELVEHLKRSLRFGVDYIIAACPNGYGGFRPDMNEGRSVAVAYEMEKKCQIILGRPKDRSFFLNSKRYTTAKQKPVFYASDAHNIDDVGSKYTWVKAKPTFEGLRQSIIEPDSRVQQNDTFVEKDYCKPRFKSITLSGKVFADGEVSFKKQCIPLNPNLVAIIGGRGTGKSLFLDAMCSRFNLSANKTNARKVSPESICLELDKGDGEVIKFESLNNNYPYLHVSQGDIQYFSQKPDDLSDEIKRMLGISTGDFDHVVIDQISSLLEKYRKCNSYFESINEDGIYINTQSYQDSVIFDNEKVISTLTNPTNNKLIEDYQLGSKSINESLNYIQEAKAVSGMIQRLSNEINEKVKMLNNSSLSRVASPLVDIELHIKVIDENIVECMKSIDVAKLNNEDIISQFKAQGINQDISSLLNKVNDCQTAIDKAIARKKELDNYRSEYENCILSLKEEVKKYDEYLEGQKTAIDEAFHELSIAKPEWSAEQNLLVSNILSEININGAIVFNSVKFYAGVEQRLNRGKFRASNDKKTYDKLSEAFNVADKESFFRLVSGEKIINVSGEQLNLEEFCNKDDYFNKGGRYEFLRYLFSPEMMKEYLYVNADFKYKGKTVDKLSVGQRGTFYVCLKLATDPFGSPFVFDQPEDDLDNEFIMSQLVPLFRDIKKYRQVIIVTHNANLVVNTDAEQIIVAENIGEEIGYKSGAVEDSCVNNGPSLRASICDVLEGGSYAFEKREQKYGIRDFNS